MPIYEYACAKCGKITERIQKVTDAPPRKCESCGGKLSRVMSRSSFQLKGGGWYKDLYSSAPEKKGGSSENKGGSDSKGSGSDSKGGGAPDKDKKAAPVEAKSTASETKSPAKESKSAASASSKGNKK